MMNTQNLTTLFLISTLFLLPALTAHAQFLEEFDGMPAGNWITFTGDGEANSSLEWQNGYARFKVDATFDRQNVWWAIMQTSSTDTLDLEKLAEPGYELRMETRVKSSHAPRRLNMQLRTQRTTDNYAQLMEYDLPDTSNWHTISMTTDNFDGRPGDSITAHIALMDWGPFTYTLDVDYVKVDVVKKSEAGPDLGEQVPYPPPVPEPSEFSISVPALETGIIDKAYQDVNMGGWLAGDEPVLTADPNKIILLRWNLYEYAGRTASGYGMLELTPFSFYHAAGTDQIEFDRVRLVEILDGDPAWTQNQVTFSNFLGYRLLEQALNTQMIIDIGPPQVKDQPVRIHIPRPVIQRLIDGTSIGIAIYPLGSLAVSFYPGEHMDDPLRPSLYLNLE